jgi:hypothetical protein
MTAVMSEVRTMARTCEIGAGFPAARDGLTGHVIFWASHVTKGGGADLLRCLAALGVSRGPWRQVETAAGTMRRADLSDLDGELRGGVIVCADGSASADLANVLTRPLKCFGLSAAA